MFLFAHCSHTEITTSIKANPSDILLFHKRRQAESAKGGKGATRKKRSAAGLNNPTEPEDLVDVNIEDLVTENLVNNEKKLELLDEKTMSEGMLSLLMLGAIQTPEDDNIIIFLTLFYMRT